MNISWYVHRKIGAEFGGGVPVLSLPKGAEAFYVYLVL